MNSERHYPTVYKFVAVTLMAFAVFIFYNTSSVFVRFYSIIEFLATLNGWAASEDDDMEYGDLYLLIDALCAACYFLTMLELNDGKYINFFLYSAVTFLLYFLWNVLLIIKTSSLKYTLRKYQVCNATAGIYSLFAYLIIKHVKNKGVTDIVQYVGMILWIAVLLVWYYDFYFKKFKGDNVS